MSGIEHKSLTDPDERVDYGAEGEAGKVSIGMTGFGVGNESVVWLSNLRPGWSWVKNIKPRVPFETCPLHHREYVIAGHIRYALPDGSAVDGVAGDHLVIEPGHLAEVVGDEDCVLLDW